MLRILYVGPDEGNCRQRRRALERLGHQVTPVDPSLALPEAFWVRYWRHWTGALGLEGRVTRYVMSRIVGQSFDLAWLDPGDLAGPGTLQALRAAAPIIINFNLDNPFVDRDANRWRMFRRAISCYDLCVYPRRSSVDAALRAGAARAIAIDQAADEVESQRIVLSESEKVRFTSEVAFVGTWMPERGPFMARLVERGVPLRIYGTRWQKAPEFPRLRARIVLGHLGPEAYARAVQGAKIALGLVSRANQDLHTTRSMEIPAMGVVFCAERTADHLRLYEDGVEAVFWRDADECADRCLELLADPARIRRIAEAGYRRVHLNKAFNEPMLSAVIAEAIRDDPGGSGPRRQLGHEREM
jgi:hypothetical protein